MTAPPALSETPTGDLALPFLGLATALSESSTFRTMVGAADAAAALPYIDYPLRDIENYGWPVPGAIITDDDSLMQHRTRLGAKSGQLVLILLAEMSETYYGNGEAIDWRNDDIAMRNQFGAIMKDILVQKPYFSMREWKKLGSPTHVGPPEYQRSNQDPDAQRWFRYAAFLIDWV